jgi:hypothetical protein
MNKKKRLFLKCLCSFVAFCAIFADHLWAQEIVNTSTESIKTSTSSALFDEIPLESGGLPLQELNQLKKVIKNDLLEEEIQKKKLLQAEKEKERLKKEEKKSHFMREEDFWSFCSEYWLVSKRSDLFWDFDHPDYGVEPAVIELFKRLLIYQSEIRLLFVKTNQMTYMYLPANKGHSIILFSVPFMKTLDLSKMEVAILVLESVLRSEMNDFTRYVTSKELKDLWGKNFFQQKMNLDVFKKVLQQYDYFIYKKGFQFQQQFELTKKMTSILRPHPKLLKLYINLLQKLDVLVKTQPLYRFHAQIYPSPEFQLKWIER